MVLLLASRWQEDPQAAAAAPVPTASDSPAAVDVQAGPHTLPTAPTADGHQRPERRAPGVSDAPGGTLPVGALTALDGDTLRLPDGRRVRLPGVDTPELGRPLADAARKLTAAHVAAGPARLVAASEARDRYGRLLADVVVGQRSLSAALVASGLAWVYPAPQDDLLALQVVAVATRRGVHGLAPPRGAGSYRRGRRRFHDPRCRSPGDDRADLPLSRNPGGLFAEGLSPCRRCLPWPPAPAIGFTPPVASGQGR